MSNRISFVIQKADNGGFIVYGFDGDLDSDETADLDTVNVAGNHDGALEIIGEQMDKLLSKEEDKGKDE